jgi:hypothetical protein
MQIQQGAPDVSAAESPGAPSTLNRVKATMRSCPPRVRIVSGMSRSRGVAGSAPGFMKRGTCAKSLPGKRVPQKFFPTSSSGG